MNIGVAICFCLVTMAALSEDVNCHIRHSAKKRDPDIHPPDLCSKICFHGGTCEKLHTTMSCVCRPGYYGERCQFSPFNEQCPDNPCQNGGTCRMDRNEEVCTCTMARTGERCEKSSVVYATLISIPVIIVTIAIVLGFVMKVYKLRRSGQETGDSLFSARNRSTIPPFSSELVRPPPYEEINDPPPAYPGNEGDKDDTIVDMSDLPPPYEEEEQSSPTNEQATSSEQVVTQH
ncbi:delta-like protein 4 [Ptychodera flava]|uniref:delta-like protein 4 n=1 Tax=Ptychodera flava TaxID=63121 RepID=UPI00396A69BE